MNREEHFVALNTDTASEAARPMLVASRAKLGFLPSPVAKAAHAPAMLKHLLAGFAAFEQTSLSALEREVIAMTVAFENDCHYCMAMHSALLVRAETDAALVEQLRSGAPLTDARLQTLRMFVTSLLKSGHVDDARWEMLHEAGFTKPQALEILLGVAVYWLSTRANVLTEAELDAPFAAFAWQKPAA